MGVIPAARAACAPGSEVFEHQASRGRHAEPLRGQQEDVGRRLAVGDFVAAGQRAKSILQAGRRQHAFDGAASGGASYGFRQPQLIQKVQQLQQARLDRCTMFVNVTMEVLPFSITHSLHRKTIA